MKAIDKELERAAELLKVLGHPVRLCIVRGLLNKSCNVSKMQGCLGLPQSTVSQQLSILRANGIIEGQRSGLEISYTVVDEFAKKIAALLPEVSDSDGRDGQ